MFNNLYLRTSNGLIQLGSFDRIGRITREAYAQVHTAVEFPFDDCKFVVMGYFPHYARLSLPAGGTLPVQSRGTPWVDKFGDPLFGVPHDAAFQTFLKMLSEAIPLTQRGPVVMNVTELERNVPVEPIGRQERPIMIGVPSRQVTSAAVDEQLRQLQAIMAEQAAQPLVCPPPAASAAYAEWMTGQIQQAYQAQAQAHAQAMQAAAGSEYFRFAGVTLATGPNRNGDMFSGPPTEIIATRRAGSDQLEILSRSPRDGSVAAALAGGVNANYPLVDDVGNVVGTANPSPTADHPVAGDAGG